MPQPTQYNRLYNFVTYALANPSAPYQPAYTDAEFNAIQTTLSQVLINLSLIQRDDGAIKNGVVTQDSLSTSIAALFAAAGSTIRGAWLTTTVYALKDVVTQSNITYICAVAHTSGVFATDLAASRWVALNSGTTIAAANVTSTPSGDVIATNVDAAIAELASEKLAKAQNLADIPTRATAFTNLVAGGGTMTGALTFSGARINEAQGANIDSAVAAGTLNLDAATGNLVDVTGTTTVTAVTLSQGREAVVRFTGALTLTNGASLVLPSGANITTAAGDFAIFRGYASGVVRCVTYSRASGLALVAPATFTPSKTNALAGSIIDTKYTQSQALLVGAGTAIPYDNTIPQITEGDLFLTAPAFTPSNASNILRITVQFSGTENTNTSTYMTVALFQDSTANAIAAAVKDVASTPGNLSVPTMIVYYMVAGTTSATTFTVRAGLDTANPVAMNGFNSATLYGGKLTSSITVEEIKV